MNPEFHLHDYSNEPRLRDMPRTIGNWPRILILALIRLYQATSRAACQQIPAGSTHHVPITGIRQSISTARLKARSWLAGVCSDAIRSTPGATILFHRSDVFSMKKKLIIVTTILLGAFLLSACAGGP